MNTIMPFDELNALRTELPAYFENGKIANEAAVEEIIDSLLDIFIMSYVMGVENTNTQLASNVQPTIDEMIETVDKKVAGKTWRERVRDYYENGGSVDDILRIAETEAHRDSNEAAFRTAKAAGATKKVWNTVGDDRVRDTHLYLDGVSVPIDGEFYSFRGGSTQYPGQWGIAEEDVNCRCWLTYK